MRRPITKRLVHEIAERSRTTPIPALAKRYGVTPYVARLIARYRDRPFPRETLTQAQRAAIRTAPPHISHASLARHYGISREYVRKLRQKQHPHATPTQRARRHGSFPDFVDGTLRPDRKSP